MTKFKYCAYPFLLTAVSVAAAVGAGFRAG